MKIVNNEAGLFVPATGLYSDLGIKRKYANWISESIERADLEDNKDFITLLLQSTGGRPTKEYLLKRDAALSIIMMSGGENASKLRKKVIELYNQHNEGLAFTAAQIEALMDLSKSLTLVSIQKEVEQRHFNLYNDKYTWYDYRAHLLGYTTKDVIEAMKLVNKKHHSIRTSLIQLDACELIRIGVIDLMVTMGKSTEYATNVGDLCKSIAKKANYGNIIWDDTKENPLSLNGKEVTDRKELFETKKKAII